MNSRYFAGTDIGKDKGAICIWDKQDRRFVVMATTPFAVRFWLLVCKALRIRVLAEINP